MTTLQCIPREALKEYVSGWTDPEQSEAIESHLTECGDCEQTVAALERDPETLIEFVRNSRNNSDAANGNLDSVPPADSAIAYALAQAKKQSLADNEASPAWQPPAGDFGPYELLRPLGHGGMASVCLARHRQLGKQVAIKLLPSRPFRNDHYAARFQREIRTAGQLNHPAIVSATDAGELAGTHYLVMEYIEGLDLSRVARLNGPLRIEDACAIMRTVAIGLSHAHAEGIVHRDIKPSNLMLSQSGEVKVLDFGLAQVSLWDEVSAELTTVGQLMGTLDYMAPEQAERPDAVDYRADLYSIGATLFRLLCGRAPLAAAPDLSPLAKLRLLASHRPPRLDTLRSDAPEKLVAFVAQLLARDPADRPASAAHVAEQLAQFTEGADLNSLIKEAMNRDAAKNGEGSDSEVARGRGLKTIDSRQDTARLEAAVGSNEGGRAWNRWRLAAAMLPLFVFAGVLITLETQKGELVIQSESADVEVKLLRDGKFYESLEIQPGTNTTRLYAGKYEVILGEGSDSVTLDRPTIEIKRGGKAVAFVTEKPSVPQPASGLGNRQPSSRELHGALSGGRSRDDSVAIPPANTKQGDASISNSDNSNELLYDGKPLSAWLRIVELERSNAELEKAIFAMAALRSDGASSERISVAIVNLLRGVTLPYKLMDSAFVLLRKCQKEPADFYRLLTNELKTAKRGWKLAILQHGLEVDQVSEFGPNFLADFEPMREWIAANVLNASRSTEQSQLIERQLGSATLYPNVPADVKKLFVDLLAQSPAVDFEYWLGDRYIDRGRGGQFFSSSPDPHLSTAIEAKALAALSSLETPKKFVYQSSTVLKEFNSKEYDRTGMPPKPSRELVAKAVAQQFERLAKEPDGIATMLEIDSRFNTNSLPQLFVELRGESATNLTNARLGFMTMSDSREERFSLAFELLDLVRAFELQDLLQPQLEQWVETASTRAAEFAALVANPFFTAMDNSSPTVGITWPRITADIRLPNGRDLKEKPTKEQLVQYLAFELCLSMVKPKERRQALLESAKADFTSKWIHKLIGMLDEDGDGKLGLEEAERGLSANSWLPEVESPITDSDTDGDTFLSVDELIAAFVKKRQADAQEAYSSAKLEWATIQISKYDKNKDGSLTQDEWSAMVVKPDGADANADGIITVEEYADFRGKNRK